MRQRSALREAGQTPVCVDANDYAGGLPDLVAASDTGASDADNMTNDSKPTFEVAAEAGSLVRIFKDSDTPLGFGPPPTTCGPTPNNKVASITSSQLADGSHSISADATDVAGY